MFDFIGKRFVAYFATLIAGYIGAWLLLDGVNLRHFYDFCEALFTVYVSGQTITDSVEKFRGVNRAG